MTAPEPYLEVEVDLTATPARVVARGELDAATASILRHQLVGLEGEPLAIDLGAVTFVDSSGLQVLAEAHRRAHDHGQRVEVGPVTAEVRRVFEMSGLADALLAPPPPPGDGAPPAP